MSLIAEQCDLVWDNHGCLPLRADDAFMGELERYRKSGYDVASINVSFDIMDFDNGFKVISFFRSWIKCHSDKYRLVSNTKEILENKKLGVLSVVFDLEGLNAIGDQVDLIEMYYDLGVRWALVAYNKNNLAGGGCLDEDCGLTEFGREVVKRMDQIGMVVCCSHTGHRTVKDVLDIAQGPIIFSHSNPSSLWQHPRNISDNLIRDCASTGGVVGINGVGIFLGKNDISTETVARNIAYVADLVGAEHVGLSLDYAFDPEEISDFFKNNRDMFPEDEFGDSLDIVEPERLPQIRMQLEKMGFHQSEISNILGGNWFRVADRVWK